MTGPMDLIANFAFLKDRQVGQMLPLRATTAEHVRQIVNDNKTDNIVFVTRPLTWIMDRVADIVKRLD